MSAPARALFDVAIIGGGASGLAAAISAARAGRSTLIIERDVDLGLPILATGNGRCNVSNAHLDPARYRYPEIARTVMGDTPEADLEAFFDSVGIMTCTVDDRLYPYSKRAESVRDALVAAARGAGAEAIACAELEGAAYDGASGTWELALLVPETPLRAPRKPAADLRARIRADRKELRRAVRARRQVMARHVIIACGGASKRTAGLFGLPHIDETPVLCPVACEPCADPAACERLDGLRVDCRLSLIRDGAEIWAEDGEVLFRAYGISGIVAFDLSRRCRAGDTAEIDLFPAWGADELTELFSRRVGLVGDPADTGTAWFRGMLAPGLAALVAASAASRKDLGIAGLVHACKHLAWSISGTTEHASAQVRRGGIPFDAVELPGLRVKPRLAPALSLCGEALDMDADCGGFNLAWAWLSGIRAARSCRTGTDGLPFARP